MIAGRAGTDGKDGIDGINGERGNVIDFTLDTVFFNQIFYKAKREKEEKGEIQVKRVKMVRSE